MSDIVNAVSCGKCNGSGNDVYNDPCNQCGGTGEETTSVILPENDSEAE